MKKSVHKTQFHINQASHLKVSSHGTFSNVHEDRHNLHENSHRLCDEIRYPLLSLTENQWKLRQHHDQNFPMEEKPLPSPAKLEGLGGLLC